MLYHAISFDAQTVEHNAFHFDGGLLAQLRQFKNGPVHVLVSEVVISEIQKHLTEKTRGARDAIEAAHKKGLDFGLKTPAEPAFPGGEPDIRAVARSRLQMFLRDIGAEAVGFDGVSVKDIMKMYFTPSPPFSASGKKKSEFPDAIALLSLEAWAKTNGRRVLAVSGDKDWTAYANNSEWIDVVEDLSEALEQLQEHTNEAERIVARLLNAMEDGSLETLAQDFTHQLEYEISGYAIDAEAEAAYHIDYEQADITYTSHTFAGDSEDRDITIVQVQQNKIVALLAAEISVRAEATFSLSIYDSIDKDYVPLGSANVARDDVIEVSILATFEGDFQDSSVSITHLELVDVPSSIDFGYIEPDYGEERYEFWEDEQEPTAPVETEEF